MAHTLPYFVVSITSVPHVEKYRKAGRGEEHHPPKHSVIEDSEAYEVKS